MLGFLFLIPFTAMAECNPNSKKVVIYLGFHGSTVELEGAETACKRGERVVVVPSESFFKEFTKISTPAQIAHSISENLLDAAWKCQEKADEHNASQNRCKILQDRADKADEKDDELQQKVAHWTDQHKIKSSRDQLSDVLDSLKKSGSSVESLILSGHDGGGHFYGDLGSIRKEDIFELSTQFPDQFKNTKSVLLMGCWSTVPNEVEDWKISMPSLKVIAGFGGSAPSALRKAGGEYISGVLAVQNSMTGTSETQAMAKLKTIVDVNAITAAVFVDPAKECNPTPKNSYYALFADHDSQVEGDYKHGINKFKFENDAALRVKCDVLHHDEEFWQKLQKYESGEIEPGNTLELRSIYDRLRQNGACFDKSYISNSSPMQVLMLRFFQDVKKNFAKYFKNDIEGAYSELDAIFEAKKDADKPIQGKLDKIRSFPRLSGDSLEKMSRSETLTAISNLQQTLYTLRSLSVDVPKLRRLAALADTHLYALKCLDDEWHEYNANQTLVPPTCGPGPG